MDDLESVWGITMNGHVQERLYWTVEEACAERDRLNKKSPYTSGLYGVREMHLPKREART